MCLRRRQRRIGGGSGGVERRISKTDESAKGNFGDCILFGSATDKRYSCGARKPMGRIKQSINSVHTTPWIERVGKIILNFSVIELESIHWFVQLSEREFEIGAIAEMPFASRVTQVMKHIEERNTGAQWRRRALRSWNEALKLAHLRNQVAHNPIIFSWSEMPEKGEPDILGIPNVRARTSTKANWLLSTIHADKSINSMVEIAKSLAELRIEWCAARDQGKAPPVKVEPRLWYKLRRRVAMALYAFKKRRGS